jgi:hypothetical protein
MLRYGELQKHSQMFWIVLSLPMWWINHRSLVIIWCSHYIY